MRFPILLPLFVAMMISGCNAPDDETPTDDHAGGGQTDDGTDDGNGTDDTETPEFSATIVAERPAFMPTFEIQPASDDQAAKIPMACGGNSTCTAELEKPGTWRLWGEADGWLITYNKVVSVTKTGEKAAVTLDQYGDYGVDVTDLVYEDSYDGERYTATTDYVDGKVVLTDLSPGFANMQMLGHNLHLDLGDDYIVTGTISNNLDTIDVRVEFDGNTVETHEYTLVE